MNSAQLSLFSVEVLGLIGREGAGPHDLLRMAQQDPLLTWAGESRYYTEPKRLAGLGLLVASKHPGRTHERTVYTLTERGLDALRAYAATPAAVPPVKSDVLIRLLICDLVGEAITRDGVTTIRQELIELEARLDEAERRAAELPHRSKYLLINLRFLRGYLRLHETLADDVERELDPG